MGVGAALDVLAIVADDGGLLDSTAWCPPLLACGSPIFPNLNDNPRGGRRACALDNFVSDIGTQTLCVFGVYRKVKTWPVEQAIWLSHRESVFLRDRRRRTQNFLPE